MIHIEPKVTLITVQLHQLITDTEASCWNSDPNFSSQMQKLKKKKKKGINFFFWMQNWSFHFHLKYI